MNLQQKLLLATLPITIAAMTILSAVQYYQSKNALITSNKGEMSKSIELIKQQVELWMDERGRELTILSKDSAGMEIVEGNNERRSNFQNRMSSIHSASENYDAIFLTDKQGKIILNSVKDRSIGMELANRDGFRLAFTKAKSGQVAIDQATLSPATGKSILFMTIPISNNGQIEGHIGATLQLSALTDKITSKIKFGHSGYPFIVESSGKLIAHPDANQILKLDLNTLDWGQEFMKKVAGEITYKFQGEDKICILNSIEKLGWKIGASATQKEFLQEIQAIKYSATVITFIISVIIFVIIYIITNRISRRINKISTNIAQGSTEILSAANVLSESSQTLSSSTTEQASSIEETSSSLEELTSMVGQNLESAKTSNMIAIEMAKISEIASEYTEQLHQAMSLLKQSNIEVKELVSIIDGISDKTKVIDEIVFQTKLLSFNASVEAERAGEHGRGFAVVAQEVGNLAQMSGKAAQEISVIIRQSIEKSVLVTQHNEQNVSKGSEVLDSLRTVVGQISQTAGQVADHSAKITSASNEQHIGLKQINIAVGQLDQTTQSSSAISEETAAASEELTQLAKGLRNSISELEEIITGNRAYKMPDEKSVNIKLPMKKKQTEDNWQSI